MQLFLLLCLPCMSRCISMLSNFAIRTKERLSVVLKRGLPLLRWRLRLHSSASTICVSLRACPSSSPPIACPAFCATSHVEPHHPIRSQHPGCPLSNQNSGLLFRRIESNSCSVRQLRQLHSRPQLIHGAFSVMQTEASHTHPSTAAILSCNASKEASFKSADRRLTAS